MKSIVFAAIIMVLQGCASYQAAEYRADPKGVELAKQTHRSYSVAPFTSTSGEITKVSCGAGIFGVNVGTHDKKPYPKYIQDALTEELELAKALSPTGTPIQMNFTNIDFDRHGGRWHLEGKLSVGQKSFEINRVYQYDASVFYGDACDSAARAFPDAVRDLLREIYGKL